jgi:hypothetical protein
MKKKYPLEDCDNCEDKNGDIDSNMVWWQKGSYQSNRSHDDDSSLQVEGKTAEIIFWYHRNTLYCQHHGSRLSPTTRILKKENCLLL